MTTPSLTSADAGDAAPPPRGGVDRALDRLAAVHGFVAVVLFALLTLVITAQIFTRFLFHLPLIWSEELARFLFAWVVMLGAALSVRNRRHFIIDVTGGWRPRTRPGRLAFAIVPDLAIIGFAILLLVQGVEYTGVGVFRIGTNSQINMAFVYAAIPVFAGLSLLYAGVNLAKDCAAFARGEDPAPPPAPLAD